LNTEKDLILKFSEEDKQIPLKSFNKSDVLV